MKKQIIYGAIIFAFIAVLAFASYARDNAYFDVEGNYRIPLEIQLPNQVRNSLLLHPSVVDIINENSRSIIVIECSSNCDSATTKAELIETTIVSECKVNYPSNPAQNATYCRITIVDGGVNVDCSQQAHQLCVTQLLG